MRQPLIAGNWKMNKTVPESVRLAEEIKAGVQDVGKGVEVALIPPATSLWAVHQVLGDGPAVLGAQNIHWETSGAFTGEVSPAMIAGWCRYALVGHSERRQMFGESDESVRRKVGAALHHGLRPMVAVGESLEEEESGRTEEVLSRQVPAALDGLSSEQGLQLVLAYEPIWAIGTGRTATPEQAQARCSLIRGLVKSSLGEEVASSLRILYGGSMNPATAAGLLAQADIDGGLVGGASLVAGDFLAIVSAAAAA